MPWRPAPASKGFFADLLAVGGRCAGPAGRRNIPVFFAALAADRSVRGGEPKHPRLAIYGLLEARLLSVDRLVLGGLDEGVWPPEARLDPWLNRPMRAALGLSSPEKRIGLAAHDFEQALGTRDVVVTRAFKRGRSPTVPSRWLQRLEASLGAPYAATLARGTAWLDLARRLDAPAGPVSAPRAPRPRPPLALRPTSLPVTRIEDLVRDPYSVYARHILRLAAARRDRRAAGRRRPRHADPRGAATLRGALPSAACPTTPRRNCERSATTSSPPTPTIPDVQAFWRPRFARIATFLADWEAERRPRLAAVETEIGGRLDWPTLAGRSFTLTARADRIEADHDGTVSVLDFKTGAAPSARQVQSGMTRSLRWRPRSSPEAAFAALAAPAAIGAPVIVRLGAGRKGCEATPLEFDGETPSEVAARSLARLKALIDRFEDEATPYVSLVHPMFKGRRYGDYDHLARVREWSLRRRGGRANERRRASFPPRRPRASSAGLRPARLGLGLGQCRLGQDERAHPARHPPAARRRARRPRSSA